MGLLSNLRWTGPVQDPAVSAVVRSAQVEALIRLGPFNALTSSAVAIVFAFVFGASPLRAYVLTLVASVLIVSSVILAVCWHWRRVGSETVQGTNPQAELFIIVPAALLGLIWATMPIALFPSATPDERLIIALTAAGLVAIAVVFAPIAAAAFWHSGLIILGAFVGFALAQHPFYWIVASLLAVFGLFTLNVIEHLGRLMRERAMDQAKLDQQKDVIGLLLCDFEENASDWLWETDVRFTIRHASTRFAMVAGCSREELQGRSLLRLVARGWGAAMEPSVEFELLQTRLQTRAAFRGLVLPVRMAGQDRWWSLTGSPIFDKDGRFTGFRGVGSDVTEAKAYEDRIAYLARFDALTGLPNRTVFREALIEAGRRAATAPCFAVLCLDLDGFKAVNDTFGHPAGDALLVMTAERLRACLREGDLVARLAGDEFAILARGADAAIASDLSRRVIDAIAAPFAVDGVETAVGVSIGIALHGADADDILKNADLALYRAKNGGRGTYRFYESEMDARMQARRALESDLRGALGREEFELLFQPIVDVATLTISSCEALLRWNCTTRGRVSPADFIPVAEESGMIIPIGEWVIAEACRLAASWPSPIRVTVNLSPVQFRSPRLALAVLSALGNSGLAPNRLELEITESILLEEKESTLRTLHELRGIGIRIALDDFGTGYSSLSYLRSFPFDKIKIDQSFVRGLGTADDSRAIIEAIIVLARHLGMTTTAEGVETQDQASALRDMGCREVQGYLFSRPKPAGEIVPILERDSGRARLVA